MTFDRPSVLQRLIDRFTGSTVSEEDLSDWDVEETTTANIPDINTEDVSVNVQLICPKCRLSNYLRDGLCLRCDYNVHI